MERLPILVPPVAKQAAIAAAVHRAFGNLEALSARAAGFRKDRSKRERAILARAFRGELVPQDPSDEAAELTRPAVAPVPKAPKATNAKRRKAQESRGARQEEA